jgi:hypothetical protein
MARTDRTAVGAEAEVMEMARDTRLIRRKGTNTVVLTVMLTVEAEVVVMTPTTPQIPRVYTRIPIAPDH